MALVSDYPLIVKPLEIFQKSITAVQCLFRKKENYILHIHISMITVVEFRTKQATESRYMLTDKFYTNYFFIKIDLNCFACQKLRTILENKVLQK